MKRIFFIAVMCIFLNAQELEDSIYLHYGFNLISFNILPEDTSLGNVFSSVDEGDINIVIGEGVGAVYIPSIGWVGSLSDIDPRRGYWVGALRDQFLFIEGYPVDTYQDYFLNSGPNLISYPFDLPININQALPSSVVWNINSIIGESVAATNVNGQFLGSLEDFYPKKGYWFIADARTRFTQLENIPLALSECRNDFSIHIDELESKRIVFIWSTFPGSRFSNSYDGIV